MKKIQLFVVLFAVGSFGLPLAAQVTLNQLPSRVLGQPNITTSAPNLVDGREFNTPLTVALDNSVNPPAMYVADTINNRVLAWRDANSFNAGAKADLVIGQRDLLSTGVLGPVTGSSFASGLHRPVGIVVDGNGNLFVADTGNNRVLRYQRPFQQQDVVLADLVIGQTTLNTRNANQGLAAPTEKTLATNLNNSTPCSACLFTVLSLDPQGNLWVGDGGNNRVLRYPSSLIAPSARANAPSADLVIGMPDFTTRATAEFIATNNAAGKADKTKIRSVNAIASDPDGNLWISDDLNRVLIFSAPLRNGKPADRIAGLSPPGTPAAQQITGPYGMGGASLGGVRGIFFIGNIPMIVDTGNSRILRFDRYGSWPFETPELPSPEAAAVIGQDSFVTGLPNRVANAEPNAWSMAGPSGAAFLNGQTYVADTANNRVLVFGDLSQGPPAGNVGAAVYGANRLVGQLEFGLRAINLVEGREMSFGAEAIGNTGVAFGLGTAIDMTSGLPRLYLADTGNHRVLGWSDYRRALRGEVADIVIGQVDLRRSLVNSPSNDANAPNDTGLRLPAHVAVDPEGNLWVTDRGNSRVLRFPRPFDVAGSVQRADLVLGQSSFLERLTDATSRTMSSPLGIAFTGGGDVVVSDTALHRVLFFAKGNGFTNGQAAATVLGQQFFTTSFPGAGAAQLSAPRHVAIDSDDRLYVCDYSNNRVQIFERVPTQASGNSAAASIRITTGPSGIDVSLKTGEIWVTTVRSTTALRFPRFDQLILNPDQSNGSVSNSGAIYPRIDPSGNLLISDVANRIAFYYPSMALSNAASGFVRIAPAMLATLYLQPAAGAIVPSPVVVNSARFPKELGDVSVLVNGVLAPLYYVYPNQVAIQVPKSAPVNGIVEVSVLRASTNEIIATTEIRMDIASPAFFTEGSTGQGQIAAINEDGTVNNASAGTGRGLAERGKIISLYLTGQGNIPGMPEDGEPPTTAVPTPPEGQIRVFIGTSEAVVQYSGLGGGYPGLWQINAVVPASVAPGNNPVVVLYRGIPTNINPANNQRLVTTIAVR